MKLRPIFATNVGLVVTPSTRPVAARSRISAISAVSMKNFLPRASPVAPLASAGTPAAFGLRVYPMPDRHASSSAATDDAGSARDDDRVSVLLPLPLAGAYDYLAPREMALKLGDFVSLPLGSNEILGVVWGAATGDVAAAKLKPVAERLDAPLM